MTHETPTNRANSCTPTKSKDLNLKHDVDEPGTAKKFLLGHLREPVNVFAAFAGAFVMLWLEILRAGLCISRAWHSYRAAAWPTTEGTIESIEVSVRRAAIMEDWSIELADARLAYSYRLDGGYYAGYCQKAFYDEQKAWDFAHGWKGRGVIVRRHPSKPQISFLRIKEQVGVGQFT